MPKTSGMLYDMARMIGRLASKTKDMEVLMSGDPKKMAKRMLNKQIYKASNKVTRKLRVK